MDEDVALSRARVSRRRALGLGGWVGLGALLAACSRSGSDQGSGSTRTAVPTTSGPASVRPSTPSTGDVVAMLDRAGTCRMTREGTQGPYWFDVDSIRTDIREDRPGTPLRLALRVQDVSACASGGSAAAIPNAVVEIWHCDAGGVYSGFEVASTGGPGGAPGQGGTSNGSYSVGDREATPTDDGTYLRGAQVTNAAGIAQFTTIYPGWYGGRTVHIHCKVHIDKKTVLTTQLYFDDELSDAVFRTAPYDKRARRETRNEDDSIYDPSGLVTVARTGAGYLGVLNLGVDA